MIMLLIAYGIPCIVNLLGLGYLTYQDCKANIKPEPFEVFLCLVCVFTPLVNVLSIPSLLSTIKEATNNGKTNIQ